LNTIDSKILIEWLEGHKYVNTEDGKLRITDIETIEQEKKYMWEIATNYAYDCVIHRIRELEETGRIDVSDDRI